MVQRWVLNDPATAESWTFPINPNRMTTPHGKRSLAIQVNNGIGRVFEAQPDPHEWTFTGVIRDQDHHDQLLYWSEKVTRLQLTDHFGRTWSIRMLHLDLREQRPRADKPWRFEYDMKTLNYGAA